MSNPDTPGMGTRKMHVRRGEAQEIRPHKQERPARRPGIFWPILAIITLTYHGNTGPEPLMQDIGGWGAALWGVYIGGSASLLVTWARALADWARGR